MAGLSIKLTNRGAVPARNLVAGIIAFAKGRGIDQNALAARAGISAESLSRLKREGGCRLGTTLELARAAGFGSLDLVPRPVAGTALASSARKLSAGRRLPISAEELGSALRTGKLRHGHGVHLYGFFEELPIDLVHDVILDESLDYARLASFARDLGAEGKTVDWLAEMAGECLADSA